MNLERIVQEVETRLVEVGRALLRPGPAEQLREEIRALVAELAERTAALGRAQAERRAAQQRLGDNQVAAALLPSQVESSLRRGKSSQAFRQALELDRVRRTLAADRDALPGLERACEGFQFHIRLLERRLDRLREQLRRRPH
jgi:hypothetical protein